MRVTHCLQNGQMTEDAGVVSKRTGTVTGNIPNEIEASIDGFSSKFLLLPCFFLIANQG